MKPEVDKVSRLLQEEFEYQYKEAYEKIKIKMAEAAIALDEAVRISEEYGVPFYADVSIIGQSYKPKSFDDKFPSIDYDFVEDVTGTSANYVGWQTSQICY
jgi:hypothetical protein